MEGRTSSRGFTLMELIIAIGIIAILAICSFAGLSQLRKRAESATCLSNLRQIGAMVHLYLGENRQTLFNQGAAGSHENWIKQIDAYAQPSKNLYRCPGDKSGPRIERTYRFNNTPANSGPPYPNYPFGKSYFQYLNPHKKIFVFCVAYSGPASMPLFKVDTETWTMAFDRLDSLHDAYPRPHGKDGVNVLFADGHAGRLQYPIASVHYIRDQADD